jgi:DNA-binding IclR family transcriptional regulator
VFGRKTGPLSLSAIVEATGKPKSSVHRILSTLINVGFVSQDAGTGLYRLTLKVWRLGMSALSEIDVLNVARPYLENLMKETDETVHLSVLDASGDVIYVSKVESPRSIRVQTQIGRLVPSWCTATGRALLAFNPAAAENVLSRPRPARTPKSETDPARLRKILSDIAAKGFAITKEENHPEMGGIAAPIRDHSGAVVAACGIAIPSFRMDRQLIQRCIPLVLAAAETISSELGYHQPRRKVRYGT